MPKYTGSVTTTGKSEAIRLEKALFRQHPEFRQRAKVEAHVIGPGQMLVSVIDHEDVNAGEDPIVMSFLSFLAKDIADHPDRVTALPEDTIACAMELTSNVVVSDDDAIADDITL